MDMSMSGMGMAMGSMSMGTGVPNLFDLQKMYWAVIGAAVAFAAALNILETILCRQRIRAASRSTLTPSKPKTLFFLTVATTTAMLREVAYAPFPPFQFRKYAFHSQPTGRIILVFLNAVILITLCFYKLDPKDQWQWENIGYRTGFITICQIPLLFLLAGKNSIIGLLTGYSYERLNMPHRWAARCLLLTATLHMGYWFRDWARWDYIAEKIKEDSITVKGLIAWAILVWIVFSSMSPVRGWNYEFFLIQHILSFAAFVAVVYIHTPAEVHVWIWISVGLFLFDRLARAGFILCNNISLFHRRQRTGAKVGGLWACKAEFEPLAHNTTRITILDPPIRWRAGQHVFLSCHSVLPLQSHPFTISSLPEDGEMVFVIRSKKGGTKSLFGHAEKQLALPSSEGDLVGPKRTSVVIDGPYGRVRPLRQFDSVVFLAGSAGATFAVPLMRDIVSAWNPHTESRINRKCSLLGVGSGAVTRHIRFVWVVKSVSQFDWFSQQLSAATEDVETWRRDGRDISIELSVYVTCDDDYTSGQKLVTFNGPLLENRGLQTHRELEELGSIDSHDEKEVMKYKEEDVSVHSVPTSTASSQETPAKPATYGPNGTCCCTRTIADEDSIAPAALEICKCESSRSRLSTVEGMKITGTTPLMAPAPAEAANAKSPLYSHITFLSGRPKPRKIIRKTLEQAYGESAVVVCGPQGLVDDVRRSVVSLSDERAIHKGTGAQGVYLHTEAFDY
ncbi:MAG: hypothetical protein M1835_006029 [Candelina submexicana]|nr:MAG: hypothetical protein M1835_006029 [Candelina submexicana]